tara:strand:+ start:2322 stop:2498 length:177 start_codon:yes stop_codon:yes gene_type:complete
MNYFIVSQHSPELKQMIQEIFEKDPNVKVIVDRRSRKKTNKMNKNKSLSGIRRDSLSN